MRFSSLGAAAMALSLTGYFGAAQAQEPAPVPQYEAVYADMHAVLAMDFSTSMKDSELKRAAEGLFNYLVSDEAKLDYKQGSVKAVTLMYFGGGALVDDTRLVSSIEDAYALIESYPSRSNGPSATGRTNLIIGDRGNISGDTDVIGALIKVGNIFERDGDHGIIPTRRVVLFIGDEIHESQQTKVTSHAQALTDNHGATVCAVAVNEAGETVAPYNLITTNNSRSVTTSSGLFMYAHNCKAKHAKTSVEVTFSVAEALSMPRI